MLPYREGQDIISSKIDVHDNHIITPNDSAAKLRSLKSALMHDLLTGRVRVDAPGQTARE